MAPSKRPRSRKPAARSPLVNWTIAAVIVGAIGFAVSQMSNIAYGEAEIKVIDFSALEAKQKRAVLEAANAARCNCGCGMTLAQCVATDSTCPIRRDNVDTIKRMVNDAARSKS